MHSHHIPWQFFCNRFWNVECITLPLFICNRVMFLYALCTIQDGIRVVDFLFEWSAWIERNEDGEREKRRDCLELIMRWRWRKRDTTKSCVFTASAWLIRSFSHGKLKFYIIRVDRRSSRCTNRNWQIYPATNRVLTVENWLIIKWRAIRFYWRNKKVLLLVALDSRRQRDWKSSRKKSDNRRRDSHTQWIAQ